MKKYLLALLLCIGAFATQPAHGSSWFVRPDGGTRYSSTIQNGQCDGKADAAYPGTGTNQHCAFNDVRYLWTDGTYCTDSSPTSTCWNWIGQGGDTYTIRGSIADGVSYRIGQSGPNPNDYLGLAGNPYGAGAPPPPSGTASQHTKILGGNYASCSAQSSKTQLHGGYGVWSVLDMTGASYVDLQCLDITDFSSCGRQGQVHGCNTNFPLDDYATNGIQWSNTSTNDTVTNVRVHGISSAGMIGPTGDGVVMNGLAIVGNAGAGWNADAGDGQTGVGHLLVENYDISWNGCAEEYPVVDALPYQDCADDNVGGYGDGFGTATVPSPSPGWQVVFDNGNVHHNTQDGLDALHLVGNGSSMTITRTLAYANMGQQIKIGGAAGTAVNNVITTNCNALRQNIPGTPVGYNSRLSDFCRAADAGLVVTVGHGSLTRFEFNTVYSASATGIEVDCDDTNGACDSTSQIKFNDNIFIGFLNNTADGYVNGGTGDFSNPIFVGVDPNPFLNANSSLDHNLTFHPKSNWVCPEADWLKETNALCVDPALTDETWHVYGVGDPTPLSTSPAIGAGWSDPNVTTDLFGNTRPVSPTIGAVEGNGTGGSITPPPPVQPPPVQPPPVIVPPTLSSIALSPSTLSFMVGDSPSSLIATETYSDGSTASLTGLSWTSSNPSVATVDSSGNVTPVAAGTSSVTASLSGVTSNGASITVTSPAPPPTPSTTPTTTTLTKKQTGKSVQFTVVVKSVGSTAVPTGTVTFFINGTPYGTVAISPSNGQAKLSIPSASLTMAKVTATYNGSSKFDASTATIP